MRTEQEMIDLILSIAKADERVRAVLINGSRANPNVPKDIYQDYDIAYMVTDIDSFTKDHSWIDVFGNRLMVQMPETMRYPDNPDGHFGYLMLFEDGNRIDLSLVPLNTENLEQYDRLTVTLLDKDGIVPDYPPSTDKDFWLKEPDELFYYSCCNNFWWCLNNVAKGIARDELPYVMNMLNDVVRSELHDMIGYSIGIQHGFNLSVGKDGKYFKRYLPPNLYAQYAATYSGSDHEDIWAAVYAMCDLFHVLAVAVAAHFGFTYRQHEEDGIREYLRMIKESELCSPESETDKERLARLYPVILSEYNPAWPEWFAEEKINLERLIGKDNIARISHIGSTAVPDLTAKPTVDILLEIKEDTNVSKLIDTLSSREYICLNPPDMPTPPPHLMFLKGYLYNGFAERVYHIHVRYPNDWDELYFRDYLISHGDAAAEYAALKTKLKDEFEHNRDGYTYAKGEFVNMILQKARGIKLCKN